MNKRDFLIVLPKSTAYASKGVDMQLYYDNAIKLWTERILQNGYNLCVIHEDILAGKLIKVDNLKRYSMLKPTGREPYADSEGISSDYLTQSGVLTMDDAVKVGLKEVVFKREDVIPGGEQAYLLALAQRRVRSASNYFIDRVPSVIYIDANNNFCKKPSHTVGDGRLVCIIDVKSEVTSCFYGGIPINDNVVLQIMEANKNGNL